MWPAVPTMIDFMLSEILSGTGNTKLNSRRLACFLLSAPVLCTLCPSFTLVASKTEERSDGIRLCGDQPGWVHCAVEWEFRLSAGGRGGTSRLCGVYSNR